MTTVEAIKRIGWRFSSGNSFKANEGDLNALNSIVEYVNKSSERTKQENRLFSKLFIYLLKEFSFHYKDINSANKKINELLCTPILTHCDYLTKELNLIEINAFFKSLDLKPTWENGQSLDEVKENLKFNKKIFKDSNAEMLCEVSETWDLDSVIGNVNYSINQAINNYKNLD